MSQQTGWSCPKCARVWAPHIAACGPCNQGIASFGPNNVPPTGKPVIIPWFTTSKGQETGWEHNLTSWNFNGDDLSYGHQDGDPA